MAQSSQTNQRCDSSMKKPVKMNGPGFSGALHSEFHPWQDNEEAIWFKFPSEPGPLVQPLDGGNGGHMTAE